MTNFHRLARLLPLTAAMAALPAFATNGYFPHGYGLKAKGMGGVSTALAQDSMGGATNPASMVWAGSRFDIGADVFSPRRDAERSGAGFPTLNGQVDSERNWHLVPEIGYNHLVNTDLSLGVTVYGNGGMNTSYPQGDFNCGGGAANMLCGSGKLGVDLMQLIVAPTVSWKLAPRHSVGASLLLGYQRFKAEGLQAFDNAPGFPPMTQSPGNVTNRGYDSSTGVGIRFGYFGRLTDWVSVGAAYSPKMNMSSFDKYSGLFAGGGDFDIPENYGLGVAFTPMPGWTVAADWQRIAYSGVASVGNPSSNMAPLGAPDGPGFGWRDIDVYKLGAAWQVDSRWTLRGGINHGQSPIRSGDVTFNILAPGVMTTHYTAGFTYAMDKDSELTGAFMYAPSRSVTGSSMFNNLMGAGAAGNETIRMRQFSVGIAWATRF
ncbi:MAG: outer membrane protein transport protein (OMPP1/FadL/TodX) [Ramlibacter sp.]|jgi:long-chain fatty acid transport protein|nr:outer membrane protein transport protein (OMPP1/FadL/TodX) [Ramlibacter sp.]